MAPLRCSGRGSRDCLVQPAPLQLALLDPQVAREVGIVAANLLDEPLCVLAPDEHTPRARHRAGSRARVTEDEFEARSGDALIDQDGDAIADHLRFLEPKVASFGLLVEDLLARPQDHREDH